MKTQYEILGSVDKLPYFIRHLTSMYKNGHSESRSAKWAANLYCRWRRARNPRSRRQASINDLERYHNETKKERAHRCKLKKEWDKSNRKRLRKIKSKHYYSNREKILEKKRHDRKNISQKKAKA